MKKFYECKQPLYATSNIFQFNWADEELLAQ